MGQTTSVNEGKPKVMTGKVGGFAVFRNFVLDLEACQKRIAPPIGVQWNV